MYSIWKKERPFPRAMAASVVMFLLLLAFFWAGTTVVSKRSSGETARIVEEAVSRAVVQCYADEGMYPPNLEYLSDNYGLSVDSRHYIVHYEAYASNIFPSITVIPLDD